MRDIFEVAVRAVSPPACMCTREYTDTYVASSMRVYQYALRPTRKRHVQECYNQQVFVRQPACVRRLV